MKPKRSTEMKPNKQRIWSAVFITFLITVVWVVPVLAQGITIDGKNLGSIVETYDPPFTTSTDVYDYIKTHLADWIETAVGIRTNA